MGELIDLLHPTQIKVNQANAIVCSKICLGMPQLSVSGLSESWLLQHAGDIHWTMLAQSMGVTSEEWRDGQGARLYASFVAFEIRGELLADAVEGWPIEMTSQFWLCGANRHASEHRLRRVDGRATATLMLISSFVRRAGDTNLGFVRATPMVKVAESKDFPRRVSSLMELRRELRLAAKFDPEQLPCTMRVDAMEDYNALGMVYFANFPRLLDRAERRRRYGPCASYSSILSSLMSRRCFYYGNADGGDLLKAKVDESDTGSLISLWANQKLLCISQVQRLSDPNLGTL